MNNLTEFISSSPVIYFIVSLLEAVSLCGICVILTNAAWKLEIKNKAVAFPVTAVLSVLCAYLRVQSELYASANADAVLDFSILLPFICVTIFFFGKSVWKAYIAVFASTLTSAVKYLILMGNPGYDFVYPDLHYELLIETITEAALFIVLLLVYLLYIRKNKAEITVLQGNMPLMTVLVMITTILFVSSMVITGTNFSPERRMAYLFTLLCFPAFAVTVVYIIHTVIKSKLSENSYRQMLEMQLKHYDMMDKKNEELRIFRHDLPKKMAPLLMYIKDGNTEDAEKIVRDFNVTVQATRPRYNTANYQLNTVLECEQQTAEQHGITIELVEGSYFPKEGIASEDIYTIFPNALDNAIEACIKLGERSVIRFESHIGGNMLFVRISNPYNGKLKIGSDGLETDKKDKNLHGYGVRSMKKALARYGRDNLNYSTENGILSVDMTFELNN